MPKRFEHSASGSSKIDTKVRFPVQLDMTPYTTRAKRKSLTKGASGHPQLQGPPVSYLYELLTVVVHHGQINTGHYISYSKSNGQVRGLKTWEPERKVDLCGEI